MKIDASVGIVIVLGIASILMLFVEPLYSAIGVILLIVFLISRRIMEETAHLPDIVARLRIDTKAITLVNRGNDVAKEIHVILVPLNIEFDVPSLVEDAEYIYALPGMVSEIRVLVTFQNFAGKRYSRNYFLSIQNPGDDDLLKPTVPLFGWK